MNDSDLIAEMARVWVDGGGDADGIAWRAGSLQVAVMAEIDSRREDAEAHHDITTAQAKKENPPAKRRSASA